MRTVNVTAMTLRSLLPVKSMILHHIVFLTGCQYHQQNGVPNGCVVRQLKDGFFAIQASQRLAAGAYNVTTPSTTLHATSSCNDA